MCSFQCTRRDDMWVATTCPNDSREKNDDSIRLVQGRSPVAPISLSLTSKVSITSIEYLGDHIIQYHDVIWNVSCWNHHRILNTVSKALGPHTLECVVWCGVLQSISISTVSPSETLHVGIKQQVESTISLSWSMGHLGNEPCCPFPT